MTKRFSDICHCGHKHTAELAAYASAFKNQVIHFYVGAMIVHADNRRPSTYTQATPDWPALFDTLAFRAFCEATVRADEAERRAERND